MTTSTNLRRLRAAGTATLLLTLFNAVAVASGAESKHRPRNFIRSARATLDRAGIRFLSKERRQQQGAVSDLPNSTTSSGVKTVVNVILLKKSLFENQKKIFRTQMPYNERSKLG